MTDYCPVEYTSIRYFPDDPELVNASWWWAAWMCIPLRLVPLCLVPFRGRIMQTTTPRDTRLARHRAFALQRFQAVQAASDMRVLDVATIP